MEVKKEYSFQVDSEIVQQAYQNQDNFHIEYSSEVPVEYCILYFSSNDLYYPNNETAFREQLLRNNRFEWYKTRVWIGHKHIFIRDINKQWYLGGINAKINTPEKLLNFLKVETKGYRVITLGSSAGGFAAVIYGQLLNAERILSFNGQFEISSLLDKSSEKTDPLIFRNRSNSELNQWYCSRNFILNPTTIFYFQSIKSEWDTEQYNYIRDLSINHIQFNTSNHGIPFLKTNLDFVINKSLDELIQMKNRINHPVSFSIKSVGFLPTAFALISIIRFGLKKIYIKTFLKAR